MARVLHMTLRKQWFDLIRRGTKKNEYREIKEFWTRKLEKLDGSGFQHYDLVLFRNGYHPEARRVYVQFKGVSIGYPKCIHTDDEFREKPCYVIRLGKVYGAEQPVKV